MTELMLVLMNRKRLTSEEAEERINEIKRRIREGESLEEVFFEHGIDPSYAIDLMLE